MATLIGLGLFSAAMDRARCEKAAQEMGDAALLQQEEIFYSARGGFCSRWHESMEYVTTVGSIRVFRYPEEIRDAL